MRGFKPVTFNSQVSFLLTEIDRVLALSDSQTLPADVVKTEQRQVLLRLRDYLLQNSSNSIPSNLIAQLETMIATQVELKKQQLKNLTQQQQSLSEEIYQLENHKQGIIASFSAIEPDPLPSFIEENQVFPQEDESLGSPIIIQEQRFQEWVELKPQPSITPETTSVVETPIETISALTDLINPNYRDDLQTSTPIWYLGLDFGTCGISAVLFNGANYDQYPLYWLIDEDETFRLPVQAKMINSSLVVGLELENYADENGMLLSKFKPLLDLAIPYYNEKLNQWKPRVNLLGIPFQSFTQVTKELFLTLKSTSETMAIDLSTEDLQQALDNLQGVVVNCPSSWSDTYRFNVREAVLQAELISESAQIFFVEEAIASMISRCPVPPETISGNPTLLLVNFGASTTEFALVSFPDNLADLAYSDFTLQSLAYGGEALEQDIFLELVYPHFNYLQPPLLELDLDLPEVAEINPDKRQFFNLTLQTKALGKSLLDIARQVNLVLQQETEFTCKLGGAPWQIKLQDLELKVILPVLEQLELQLDVLLTKAGKTIDSVSQIICTGGANFCLNPLFSRLLQKKYPHAALVQDSLEEAELSVAVGLSRLPLFPKIIDYPRHQYSDYFLLLEVLETIPKQEFSFEEILRALSRRGINTRVCSATIFGFLHGNLPQGIVPNNSNLFTETFFQNSPVLFKEKNGHYKADLAYCYSLRQYLTEILAHTRQSLREPLIVNLSLNQN